MVICIPFNLRSLVLNISIGPRWTIHASKEIILSAGSIGTPQILLLSGIGDTRELSAAGVEPLHHLPSVGKNLSDHVRVTHNWFVNSTDTFDDVLRNSTLRAEMVAEWERTGPPSHLVNTFTTQLVFIRLGDSVLQEAAGGLEFDPAAGPHTPHIELSISVGFSLLTVVSVVANKQSRMDSMEAQHPRQDISSTLLRGL